MRPDDVLASYADSGCALTIRPLENQVGKEGRPAILVEGDSKALLFLADLILAQATDPLDCGIEISPDGPGSIFLTSETQYGVYVHLLPCSNGAERNASFGT